jgi:HAD superfamily phosphatase (TIGR01668 family)
VRRFRRVPDALRWLVWGTKVLVRGTADLASLVGGGHLAEAMEPWMRCRAAEDIPFEQLARDGVRAVLFDLENTLIPPGGPFDDAGRKIVERARAAGLAVGVVSNASASWVPRELEREDIPFVAPAGKPATRAFERGCALLGVTPSEAVYAGDQVITDVLGAQRAGLRAILLEPTYTKEALSSRFQRLIVRAVERVAART